MLTKEQLLEQWGEYPVQMYVLYLPLPQTSCPPSFISKSFGDSSAEKVIERELGATFEVLEDNHPRLKGTFTTWQVLRVEIYPGTEDCAYDFIAICHCDRVSDSIPPEKLEEIIRTGERIEKEKAEYYANNPI